MDMLTEFVDQLAAEEAATTASAAVAFPTMDDFDKGATGAFKWRDLVKCRVYQVLSARSIHPPSRNLVCSLSSNHRWVLLHSLGMRDTNERTVTESRHAQGQDPTAICMSNWVAEEHEGCTMHINYYNAKTQNGGCVKIPFILMHMVIGVHCCRLIYPLLCTIS